MFAALVFLMGCGRENPIRPTYWSQESIKTINDLAFVRVNGMPFFAIGVDTKSEGPWDGVSGPNQCADGKGRLNNAPEMSQQAVDAGANFIYVWGVSDEVNLTMMATKPQVYGRWTDDWGIRRPKDKDTIPIIYNGGGERDMLDRVHVNPFDVASELAADFQDFQNRIGNYSLSVKPNLPSYEEIPWFSWHPTWRMRGAGDGTGEELTSEEANAFAMATNMMIGDSYTYVCNRFDERYNSLTGQKGKQGECYNDWLTKDDPDHKEYFDAAWGLAHSIRTRSYPDTVIWMWMQGYAFDDGIGLGICENGNSDSWAMGPFPSMVYLRKEISSTIAAGGTGIIFFGYMYNRPDTAVKVRSLMRALSHKDVYDPALLSPRLDLGIDLTNYGKGGRAHLIAKWDQKSRQAFLIGANPGGRATTIPIDFPWTIGKAELLDWDAPGFVQSNELKVSDRRLTYTIPRDEGFIIRITPLFDPQ